VPTIRLVAQIQRPPTPVVLPVGGTLNIPTVQYRCLIRLPNYLLPQDAIIDTGAPLIYFPKLVWGGLRDGTDFEWLPFAAGVQPPQARITRWQFTYRFARLLAPIGVMDYTTEVDRPEVVAAFADSDPPAPATRKSPAPIIVGLWGGLLEGGRIAVGRDPVSGHVTGAIEFP
jgi:hypothetical protein